MALQRPQRPITSATARTFTSHHHNALRQYIQELEQNNAAFASGYEALLGELIELHLDMPTSWSKFLIEHHHRHRLPESVMADIRANLEHLRLAV